MSVRQVIYYGNKILRQKSEKIKKITPKIRDLIVDMFETAKSYNGIGLAAPQIGISKSLFIIDLEKTDYKTKMIVINPKILKRYGDDEVFEEGCLSIPEIYADVVRKSIIDVEFTDFNGKKQILKNVDELLARVFQHEFDHLNGTLFVDKISKEDKEKYKEKLKNLKLKARGIK